MNRISHVIRNKVRFFRLYHKNSSTFRDNECKTRKNTTLIEGKSQPEPVTVHRAVLRLKPLQRKTEKPTAVFFTDVVCPLGAGGIP